MKKYFAIFGIIIISQSACLSHKATSILNEFETVEDISKELVYVNVADSIISASRILSFGDYLIYDNIKGGSMLKVFNFKTNETQDLVNTGKSQNELLNVGFINKLTGNRFYTYDLLQDKIMEFDIDLNGICTTISTEKFELCNNFVKGKRYLIGQPSDRSSRYIIINNGKKVNFGDFKDYNYDNIIGSQIYGGCIILNESVKRFASFAWNAEEFQIVDFSDINNCKTVISTVLGLLPFVVISREPFWFSFAAGTMGGMIFSLIAIVIFLPVFLPLTKGHIDS